jgi:alkylation response protein AidB-like acyl-CoA dehydrogenase
MAPSETPTGANSLDATTILGNARALVPAILDARNTIEAERRLPEDLLEKMSRAGIFRMAMPRAWGGPEMNPIEQIELMEILARADASTAWCASILSDSGFYAGFLEDAAGHKLFADLDSRCAGMLAPVGRAEITDGGYRVSGHWSFGSGCLHATHLTGGCLLLRNGQSVVDDSGMPVWRVMIFAPSDAEILDTWHTTGLAGSGSNDYRVENVFVPEEHTFDVLGTPRRSEPLYRYHGFFFANVPGIPLGIGQAALEAARELAGEKISFPAFKLLRDDTQVQVDFAEAQATFEASRAYVMDVMGNAWRTLLRGDPLHLQDRTRIGLCIIHAGRSAQHVVELACRIAGSSALYRKSPLERLRRDMIAVNSHFVHQTKTYASAGRMLLGTSDAPSFF